jgi:hypothetical protein
LYIFLACRVFILSSYVSIHRRAAAFDVVASYVATHGCYRTLYGFAPYVAAHGTNVMRIALDCNIAASRLDAFDVTSEFNLDDWEVFLIVLIDWLAVDEDLTVNKFHV